MKIKTADLQGAALDWAVVKCECLTRGVHEGFLLPGIFDAYYDHDFVFSGRWALGGRIIERERLQVSPTEKGETGSLWCAFVFDRLFEEDGTEYYMKGPTPLVAAMRCYVESKLGSEVDVPDSLVGGGSCKSPT